MVPFPYVPEIILSYFGPTSSRVASRRYLTAKSWLRAQIIPCGICGGPSEIVTRFCPRQLHSALYTNIPFTNQHYLTLGICSFLK